MNSNAVSNAVYDRTHNNRLGSNDEANIIAREERYQNERMQRGDRLSGLLNCRRLAPVYQRGRALDVWLEAIDAAIKEEKEKSNNNNGNP
jgi:hypothetical protein